MITIEKLRQRITETNAWDDLHEALAVQVSVTELMDSKDNWSIRSAFGSASVKSEKLRQKVHAYPIPDWEKMGQYSDFSLLYHLESGLTDACQIAETIYHFCGPRAAQGLSILDFGAGLGRILRYQSQFLPEHNYFASEVNPLAIKWGQQAYPKVKFIAASPEPPLQLPSASLDVAYAWSIFSHYSEGLHSKWLVELARTIKSGGLLILTVQGRILIDRMAKEENIRQIMRLWDQKSWDKLNQQFETIGYAFYESYTEESSAGFGIDPKTFGMAFVSPTYIQTNWTRDFEVVQFEPGKISNWQDYVVLRRK